MKSSSGVMRKGCRCSPKKSRYIVNSCGILGYAENLPGAEGLPLRAVGAEALADGAEAEILQQLLQPLLALVQIGVVAEPGEPAGVIKPGLLRVNLPGVEIEHLGAMAVAGGVVEQIAEQRVWELAEIAATRCRNR